MKKIYNIILVFCLISGAAMPQIKVKTDEAGVLFTERSEKVLFYQAENKFLTGEYSRSNYIHPLYTLDGEVMTEDFPADHLHHRGIFWAWHQLYIGDKRIGDGWEIKQINWHVDSLDILDKGMAKSLHATVLWKSPLWLDDSGNQKPFIREQTVITVHPSNPQYRKIDIQISLLALEPNMRIGGSENDKGYGGFSARIRLVDDLRFNSSNGAVTPDNLPVWAGDWMDFSGSYGKDGAKAGLTILPHSDNPGFPNPWILRAKGSMQNAVYPHPGAVPVKLSTEKPIVLRYRLIVHDGELSIDDIDRIYEKYYRQ